MKTAVARCEVTLSLTRKMSEGNEQAYRDFYAAYYHRLTRFALTLTRGDEESAKEVLQKTLLKVVKHIRPFSDPDAFWCWLVVLAKSAAIDEGRKKFRYLGLLSRFFLQREEPSSNGAADKEEWLWVEHLPKALERLSLEERTLIEEKYYSRRSNKELAGIFECSEKALETRLIRVRRKLRELLVQEMKS